MCLVIVILIMIIIIIIIIIIITRIRSVERGICPITSVCTVLLSQSRDHAHFLEIFVRCHVGTIPGNMPAKFEVRIYSHFGAISI